MQVKRLTEALALEQQKVAQMEARLARQGAEVQSSAGRSAQRRLTFPNIASSGPSAVHPRAENAQGVAESARASPSESLLATPSAADKGHFEAENESSGLSAIQESPNVRQITNSGRNTPARASPARAQPTGGTPAGTGGTDLEGRAELQALKAELEAAEKARAHADEQRRMAVEELEEARKEIEDLKAGIQSPHASQPSSEAQKGASKAGAEAKGEGKRERVGGRATGATGAVHKGAHADPALSVIDAPTLVEGSRHRDGTSAVKGPQQGDGRKEGADEVDDRASPDGRGWAGDEWELVREEPVDVSRSGSEDAALASLPHDGAQPGEPSQGAPDLASKNAIPAADLATASAKLAALEARLADAEIAAARCEKAERDAHKAAQDLNCAQERIAALETQCAAAQALAEKFGGVEKKVAELSVAAKRAEERAAAAEGERDDERRRLMEVRDWPSRVQRRSLARCSWGSLL